MKITNCIINYSPENILGMLALFDILAAVSLPHFSYIQLLKFGFSGKQQTASFKLGFQTPLQKHMDYKTDNMSKMFLVSV